MSAQGVRRGKAATKQSFGCCTLRPDLDDPTHRRIAVANADEHPCKRRLMANKRSSSHASGTSGVPPAPDVGGTPREGLRLTRMRRWHR